MLRTFTSVLALVTVLALAACGSSAVPEGEARVPESSNSLEGEQFENVVALLEGAGFTNVETEALGDLITGWLKDPGEVKEVAIGGDTNFAASDTFPTDVAIVVYYHSFPEGEEAEEPEPEPETTSAPSADDGVVTIENNAEFAAIVSLGEYCSGDIAAFASTYRGRILEFNGNIGALNNSGSNTTRFDILVGVGDYSATSQPGPAFQFRDVNITSDLGLTGANVPDTLSVGNNIIVTAEVRSYESSSCLFLLDPISTQFR